MDTGTGTGIDIGTDINIGIEKDSITVHGRWLVGPYDDGD